MVLDVRLQHLDADHFARPSAFLRNSAGSRPTTRQNVAVAHSATANIHIFGFDRPRTIDADLKIRAYFAARALLLTSVVAPSSLSARPDHRAP
jgi:hypothetical protein